MWNNNGWLQEFRHPTTWYKVTSLVGFLLKQTNKNRNSFLGNWSYPGWHLFQLNDGSVVDYSQWAPHLLLHFVTLWASRGCEAASMFESSSDISLFRQNVRLFNCIFNCLVRQRLIGLTSCCRMLRDMNLQHSSLNTLISLNTVCLCLQNVVISQWVLRTAVHKQIFWNNAIS